MEKKWKWWLLLIPVILVLAAAVLFRDAIIMHTASKPILTAAISDAITTLEERSQGSPLRILAKGYDESGINTTIMEMKTTDSVLGEIDYDMTVQTDFSANQVLAEGTVSADGNSLELSVYLDRKFAALTSEELLQGGYYGITYDTFASDIRSFPLLTFLIPSETIEGWEESVAGLQERMGQNYQLPQIPDITQEDIRMLMLGILALKSDVTMEPTKIYDQNLECYKLTYSASGVQVNEVLGYLMGSGSIEDGEITASFYLYEKTLVKAEFSGTAGEDSVFYDLTLGQNAAVDDLSLVILKNEKGEKSDVSLLVRTRREGELCAETICINDTAVSYDWNTVSGDMILTLPEKTPISLNLTDTEDGFCIVTKDLAKLMNMETEKTYDCAMTVSKGAEITTPKYKNMDKWSMDDFLVLLGGIGSLIGLNAK